ncbi:MAG: zinc-finger domain-containing protein [Alphaproteobacteria bacterium]|nr:zinc-finger domain-containing protein [Alphaproteobacteria bacterium]
MDPVEIITTETPVVGCDGGTLGHPLVYLNLGEDGRVDCPYCGRRFVLAEGAKAGGGH